MHSSKWFPRTQGEATNESGMSLIEIIIVMALVGGLMAVIVTHVTAGMRNAKEQSTQISFNQLKSTLQMYKMQNHKVPTTEQGLKALLENPGSLVNWRGPYCEPELLQDSWGQDIQYESDGKKYSFVSAGHDEQFGTEDDLAWPKETKTAAAN